MITGVFSVFVQKECEMFYRPEFCCSCGEKIERVDWKPWTSRRFCGLCATKHQVAELAPKALGTIGVLAAVLGFGTYFQTPKQAVPPVSKRALMDQTNAQVNVSPNFGTTEPGSRQSQTSSPNAQANLAGPRTEPGKVKTEPVLKPESVYFCGAETKKGTACTRKVKGNVRCWQHKGMPAMVPPEKLLVSN